MQENNINLPTFKDIEVTFFRKLQEHFAEGMVRYLKDLDQWIMETRDTARYRMQDLREVTLSTLFGEITFRRRLYKDREKNCYVYLLDQYLAFDGQSGVSPHLEELAVEMASKGPSYREASKKIEAFVGYPVMSHETIRDRLIRYAQQEIPPSNTKRKLSVLFVEVDGLHTKMQGGKRRGMENQVATLHEGWQQQGDRVLLQHKRYYLHESDQPFWEGFGDFLVDHYDVDESTWLVVNGDGAKWIGECTSYFHRCIYTLDRFHVVRDLRRYLRDFPSSWKAARKALNEYDPEAFIAVLEAVDHSSMLEHVREDWIKYKRFIRQHKEHLLDYRKVLQSHGVDTTGMRAMGSAESQMSVLAQRTKGGGYSWSIRGVRAMLQSIMARKEGRPLGTSQRKKDTQKQEPPAFRMQQIFKESKEKAEGCINGMIRTLHTAHQNSPLGKALKGLKGF